MGEKKRVYIVVKTYPTISKEYSELVCTAGLLEDGSWIRLYPVPFRKLEFDQKYPKYTWIELEAERNTKDFRPETFRPNLQTISVEQKPKKTNWDYRRQVILGKSTIYTDLSKLISEAKEQSVSLAIFKPTKVTNFKIEEIEREWDPNRLSILQSLSMQQSLFQTAEELEEEFKVVQKVPYKFSYTFEDCTGKQSTMMIEDWEIGMLYFNCLKGANGDEKLAVQKVKEKYFDSFTKRDLYFFLGTTLQHHRVSKNPFIIIGTFHPPLIPDSGQISLFD